MHDKTLWIKKKTVFYGLDLKKTVLNSLLLRINVRGNVRDYIHLCCVMKEKLPSQKTVIEKKNPEKNPGFSTP